MAVIRLRRNSLLCGVGVAAAAVAIFAWTWHDGTGHPDFDQLYLGAKAVRAGVSPYDAGVLPAEDGWPTRLPYPLPSILLVLPLTLLPIRIAGGVFVAATAFALGAAIAATRNKWLFAMLASQAFISCAGTGQWSMLFLASVWLPFLGAFAVAKPNVGIIAAAHWQSWRPLTVAAVCGLVLVIGSFAVRSDWASEWRGALGSVPFARAPLFQRGGFLALAALLRWRRPEARYLLAYACIPQTPGPYTDLMLFAIPRAKWEILALSLLSHVSLLVYNQLPTMPTLVERVMRYGEVSALLLMLPCVAIVVLRPNVNEHSRLGTPVAAGQSATD